MWYGELDTFSFQDCSKRDHSEVILHCEISLLVI